MLWILSFIWCSPSLRIDHTWWCLCTTSISNWSIWHLIGSTICWSTPILNLLLLHLLQLLLLLKLQLLLQLKRSSLILENSLIQLFSAIPTSCIIILLLIHHYYIWLLISNHLNVLFLASYHVWREVLILLSVVELLA